jgi:predicted kinase
MGAIRQLVVLNGPPGVGKTTVGRQLAATARNGVCIHGDDIKHFVVSREPGTVPSGMTYVGGAAVADTFLDAGYDLVVFEFIFSDASQVARFSSALRARVQIKLFTLWASLSAVEARELARVGRRPLGPRVAQCWHELHANLDQLGTLIDANGEIQDVIRAVQAELDAN